MANETEAANKRETCALEAKVTAVIQDRKDTVKMLNAISAKNERLIDALRFVVNAVKGKPLEDMELPAALQHAEDILKEVEG